MDKRIILLVFIIVFSINLSNAINVNSCTDLSTTGGSYILTDSISTSRTCLNITANNVILDFDGYNITGDNTGADYAVYSSFSNITIKNGFIYDFLGSSCGLVCENSAGIYLNNSNNSLINNMTIQNSSSGVYLKNSNHNTIANITLTDIRKNIGDSAGIFLSGSDNNTIQTISANLTNETYLLDIPVGIFLGDSNNNTLRDITIRSEHYFEGVWFGEENRLGCYDNIIYNLFATHNLTTTYTTYVYQNVLFIDADHSDNNELRDSTIQSDLEGAIQLYSGNNTLSVFNVTFNVSNVYINSKSRLIQTMPSITLDHPEEINYPTNMSLPLNYSFKDKLSEPLACWYNVINSSDGYEIANTTIANCVNTTFNVSDEQVYTLNIYSNFTIYELGDPDSSTGEYYTASKSSHFGVSTIKPAVVLDYPPNGTWSSSVTNYFNYTATDSSGLSFCAVYHNFDGFWGAKEFNTGVTSGQQNFTTYTFTSDGDYKWNVRCFDTSGNNAFALRNFSFGYDSSYPHITIAPISTTAGDRAVSFTATHDDISCNQSFYSVFNESGSIENNLENETLSCTSLSGTFAVISYGTYNLTVYVKDKVGYENSTTTQLTITSGGVTSGGGGEPVIVYKVLVPVLGLIEINETDYTNLDREILFARINEYIAKKKQKNTLAVVDNFAGTYRLTFEELEEIRELILEKYDLDIPIEQMEEFFKKYENRELFQGFEDKETYDKFDLFSFLLSSSKPLTIFPPSIADWRLILTSKNNITLDNILVANKDIRECLVVEGGDSLTCELLTNNSVVVHYTLKDLNFLTRHFSGSVSITSISDPGTIDLESLDIDSRQQLLEVKMVPISRTVTNISIVKFGLPVYYWMIIGGIGITGLSVLGYTFRTKIYKTLKGKK